MKRYYLSTFIGDGSHENPFRPDIADKAANWSMIDLRPDCARIDRLCLVCADSPTVIDSAATSLLTDDLTSKAVSTRDILNSKLGLSLTNQTLPDLVAELLIAPQRNGLCPSLRPGKDGKHRIYLGGQIYGEPSPEYRHGTIHDTFNRADQTGLGTSSDGTWSWTITAGGMNIVSNQAKSAGSLNNARADSDLSSANHYAQIKAVAFGASGAEIGCAVRYSSSADTLYRYIQYYDNNRCYIYKLIAGAYTILASDGGHARVSNTIMKLTADGTTLTGYWDTVQHVQVTDTTETGGLQTNIRCGITAPISNNIIDDFEAAELGGGVTAKTAAETGSGVEAKTSGNPIVTFSRTETGSGAEAALKSGAFNCGDAGLGSETSRTQKEAMSEDGGTGYDARKSLVKPGDTGSDMRLSKNLGQAGMPSRQARMPSKGVNI